MNIYEYQAKEILRKYGVAVPQGEVASSPLAAERIARQIDASSWVVKAQILAGGRGKAGGIKITNSLAEVKQFTQKILTTLFKTAQSGSAQQINRVLVEECCDIARELYLAITLDRFKSRVVCIASSEGGVEIEEVTKTNPAAIFKEYIDPATGIMAYQARNLSFKLGISDKDLLKKSCGMIDKLYKLFIDCDCMLAEINPLVITKDNNIVALDAKLSFDDSALYRQPTIAELRDWEQESVAERIARQSNLSYISLEGNIGCMVNGAGLAMATTDSLKIYGGEPANFLDVGGGASKDMVTTAFKILISDQRVKAILVNIFGGILKCDLLAEGVVAASKAVKLKVPLVVRLEGTNVERGRQILKDSGLNIISEPTMREAAQKAVQLVVECLS